MKTLLKVLGIFLCVMSLFGCDLFSSADKPESGPVAETPRIYPNGGEFTNDVSVVIQVRGGSDSLYYTLDGSVPTKESPRYTGTISLSSDATVTVMNLKEGMNPAGPVSKSYTFKCAAPLIEASNSAAGSVQVLSLSSETEGAQIHYTLDGTPPGPDSSLYDEPLFLSSSAAFRAVATRSGYADSGESSETFTVDGNLFSADWALTGASVTVSDEAGDRFTSSGTLGVTGGNSQFPSGNFVFLQPDKLKQTIDGFGGSFTESAAYILSYLSDTERSALIDAYFGPSGADYTLTRTHVGSCDFSVEGKYSYAPSAAENLADFSVAEDKKGFADTPAPSQAGYSGLYDGLSPANPSYDLLPLIKEALAVNPDLRIIASPWTAPAWMKSNNGWFGGDLKAANYSTYAAYIAKYLAAYKDEGVDIWALTPVNEPHGNGGQWESMTLQSSSEGAFIADNLGPAMAAAGFSGVKILGYDQNRDGVEEYARGILGNAASAAYTYGTAVHWYESSNLTFNAALDAVHGEFPDKALLHTEGCIDSLGDDEPLYSWWQDDGWWWNENATEWGYYWASDKSLHPKYTPVHRYARNIIEGLNHWLTGWVDWNLVLDKRGGPNHVANFCGAPVMIDPADGTVYYTPLYDVMRHVSRFIRPGDRVMSAAAFAPGLDPDAFHAAAVLNADGKYTVLVLNTSKEALEYDILAGSQKIHASIPANAIQTLVLD